MRFPKIFVYKKGPAWNKVGFAFYLKYEYTLSPVFEVRIKDTKYCKKGDPYVFLPGIVSERDLAWHMLNAFGGGEYFVKATVKGHRGFWTFWRGEVNRDGFIFFNNDSKPRGIKRMLREASMASSEEERQEALSQINDEKAIAKEEKHLKRYGFYPFLRSSGQRGEMHYWNDEGLKVTERRYEYGVPEFHNTVRKKERIDKPRRIAAEMAIDELNASV